MERLIALVAVALLVVAGAYAVDDSARRSADAITVENESFTPTDGINGFTESNRSAVYYEPDPLVTTNGSNVTVVSTGNWSWINANGTLSVTNQSYLDNQSSANITYRYSEPDGTTRQLAAVFGAGLNIAQLLVLVLAAGLLLAAARAFGGM